ncbi:NAD-dependent DNA ligase LigA [Mycoplasma leonicaptivi]|uniref:NAD-dependent DNA ligase LigA n=1 Tax=Mycoplasma leonicaptivi TaxID=36742 RepID=UPI00055AE5A5|nr:NAD-dependent DNA ligase LigA [Mycoplasma leonicaptivi]
MKPEVQQLYNTLKTQINQWNKEYYDLDNPSVSDSEYDLKYQELLRLCESFPELLQDVNNPVHNIGAKLNNLFEKVTHKKPMLSLNKAYSKEDCFKNYNDILESLPNKIRPTFSLEPKIDGLSISLIYKNGYLKKGITRGNGKIGEDVTANVLRIKSIPKKINFLDDIEIRGEIFLSKNNFLKLNQEIEKENQKIKELNKKNQKSKKEISYFANARNVASGTLRQKTNPDLISKRNLDALLYDIVDAYKYNIFTQEEVLMFLKNNGFMTHNIHFITNNFQELWNKISFFGTIKNTLDYDCDGLVLKLNEIEFWNSLGSTSKFPKYAFAYKYETEEKTTQIKNIFATVGRTGKITYVAEVQPIELNQTIVSNATLHNYDYIKNLNINIGDSVLIIKSGEIIPKIIKLEIKNSDSVFEKVEKCPSCGSTLVEYNDIVDQFCENLECNDKIINKLSFFVSRDCLNIENLGQKWIEAFYNVNLINKNIESIFEITKEKLLNFSLNENMTKLNELNSIELQDKETRKNIKAKINNLNKTIKEINEGKLSKQYINILNSIEKSKYTNLSNVVFALGIKNIGKQVAELIVSKISKLSDLLTININDFINIAEIGPKIIESINDFISLESNKETLKKLDSYLVYKNEIQLSSKLKDLKFAITGTLSKSRHEIIEIIKSNGGIYSSSISKDVNYLLWDELSDGSKITKAKKLNIKLINEKEFNEML